MSIYHLLQNRSLPLELVDYNNWTRVPKSSVKKRHRTRFEQLRRAIQYMCDYKCSLRETAQLHGFSHNGLHHVVDRALTAHPDGQIYGERAYIKYAMRGSHGTATADNKVDAAGPFNELLREFPKIETKVLKALKTGKSKSVIHDIVKKYLLKKGFTDYDYPLNTDSQGEWSVRKLCKTLESAHFREVASSQGGDDASRRSDTSNPMEKYFLVDRPYQRLELDEHILHADFCIDIENPDGSINTVVLKRLIILAAIDTDSRLIVGYRISMNAQATVEDVALTVANILDPDAEFMPDTLPSVSGGGRVLPDGDLKLLKFRAFDELALDNALAHASLSLNKILIEYISTAVNLGKSRYPEGRPLIEAWFKKLARYLCDPLPSSTGSHARDPKRRNSAQKAKTYKISLADLDVLVSSVVCSYNQKTHGAHGRSPIGQFRHRLSMFPTLRRLIRTKDRGLGFLFQRTYHATIAGSVKTGNRPYIQFLRAIYRNPQLAHMGGLIGTRVSLVVDIRDLRCIEAFMPSGESIGKLVAQGGWSRTPHSLQTRRAINRHLNRERVRGRIDDYVQWYVSNLMSRKKSLANAPNQVTRINLEVLRGLGMDKKADDSTKRRKDDRQSGSWPNIGPKTDLDDEE